MGLKKGQHKRTPEQLKAKLKLRLQRYDQSEKGKVSRMRARLKLTYGISPEIKNAMMHDQGCVCACCGDPFDIMNCRGAKYPCVDHDHATGRVRAILCRNCNSALGALQESPDRIQKLLNYISKYQLEKIPLFTGASKYLLLV